VNILINNTTQILPTQLLTSPQAILTQLEDETPISSKVAQNIHENEIDKPNDNVITLDMNIDNETEQKSITEQPNIDLNSLLHKYLNGRSNSNSSLDDLLLP